MRPVFVARNVEIANEIQIVGKKHLKFKVKQNNITIDSIYFNALEEKETLLGKRNSLDIAFSIEENTWNGTTTIQLRIMDYN